MGTERADRLLRNIQDGRNGKAVSELLEEFLAGYPLENLRLLLHSKNDDTVKAGAFIASELGGRFSPLMNEVVHLLEHPVSSVRFDALDIVLDNATHEHGEIVADAVMLACDPIEAIRWKALRFLAHATETQLRAGAQAFGNNEIAILVSWLIQLNSLQIEQAKAHTVTALDGEDPLVRKFAAVAAARLASDDPSPLQSAASSMDPEIKQFAQDELGLLEV